MTGFGTFSPSGMTGRTLALVRALEAGSRVSFTEIRDVLAPAVHLLDRLEATPQDAEWHAEGNVAVHSALVVERAHELADEAGLTGETRAALILAAALHDVGKAVTTRREVDETGRVRLRSPRHARRGRDRLALTLPDAGLPTRLTLVVLALVATHHRLGRTVDDPSGRAVWGLARTAPLPLLVLLARADARGRVVAGGEAGDREEAATLLQVLAEEQGLWFTAGAALVFPDPYAAWADEVPRLLPSAPPELLHFALVAGKRDFEAGLIHTPHEAAARAYRAASGFPQFTVMCGPGASGKSTSATDFGDVVVSLDALRAQIGKGVSDQSVNGQVLQAAREEARVGLRAGRRVVWDATNLRVSGRAGVLGLGFDYGALTRVVTGWTPSGELPGRNAARLDPVPPGVLGTQLETLEWPEVGEAHELLFITPDGALHPPLEFCP
ncbi:AAA family ATPase [Deinococcus hopiensis]|uniref:Predicted kinase n=1 Tax=Deinococcus hopiensis KR-140 TaxID=695939 RepID=A0A1W1VP21_9DEIO|nr:AAA family ATPase [Deinococcus hopiensis]SMB94821.1 Predicted kinase [Deinococcus hopiensis KR-140]